MADNIFNLWSRIVRKGIGDIVEHTYDSGFYSGRSCKSEWERDGKGYIEYQELLNNSIAKRTEALRKTHEVIDMMESAGNETIERIVLVENELKVAKNEIESLKEEISDLSMAEDIILDSINDRLFVESDPDEIGIMKVDKNDSGDVILSVNITYYAGSIEDARKYGLGNK